MVQTLLQQTGQADQEHGPSPWKRSLQEIEEPLGPKEGKVPETGESRSALRRSWETLLWAPHICLSTCGKRCDLFMALKVYGVLAAEGWWEGWEGTLCLCLS